MTEYLSPVAFFSNFFKYLWKFFQECLRKKYLPVLVKQQNATSTSRRRILLSVDHYSM